MLVFLQPGFSASEGLALVGNRVDYHVFAVIGLCLLFLFKLRLAVVWDLKREM